MEQVNIFDGNFQSIIKDGVQFLQMDAADVKESVSKEETWTASNSAALTCSYCKIEFDNSTQQREHYKLDWHRYNLKQSLLSRPSLTEEEFTEKTDDISSISGSDSDSDSEEDSFGNYASAQGKLFLKNNSGRIFSIYRCLLFDKKDELEPNVLLERLSTLTVNLKWAVLMLGGGHFAGGVFHGTSPKLHKTFHCYTVRAGQGSSQGSRDNKSGGSQPKSAGASLRRYNEVALVQHVKDILEAWKEEIASCNLIVYRAAGPYNRSVLFGGKVPILNRADSRLITIPFSTRRATFMELKRVHSLLTTIHVYESTEAMLKQFPKLDTTDKQDKRSRSKLTNIHRSKSREDKDRSLPIMSSRSTSSESEKNEGGDKTQMNEIELLSQEQDINFRDSLQCFEDTLSPEDRKKGKKARKPKKSKNQRLKERESQRRKEMCEAASTANLEKLQMLLNAQQVELENQSKMGEEQSTKHQSENVKLNIINDIIDDKGNTLLHVAAIHEQVDVIKFLLDHDADLCIKNDKLQTAYTCTQSKDVRSFLKEFAQDFPDKYNYNKAQIPTNVLTAEEQQEKKKMQRKAKKEKEKEKKKQNAIKQQEEDEQKRFLNLSDREKRALAAERRIISQSGVVISRCFLCAADMSGKVPFEYSGNRFCSIACLKAHRLQNPVVLS